MAKEQTQHATAAIAAQPSGGEADAVIVGNMPSGRKTPVILFSVVWVAWIVFLVCMLAM